MDSEVTALVSTGATTIVGLLATDGWEQARTAVGALWRRVHPERAEAVLADLDETRSTLLAARAAGDEQAGLALIGEWQGRLERLLTAFPDLAVEVRRVMVQELGPALAAAGGARSTVEMHAHASDQGKVYQAARDLHINEG